MSQVTLVVLAALVAGTLTLPLLLLPPPIVVPWAVGPPGFVAVYRSRMILPSESQYSELAEDNGFKTAVIPSELRQNQTARLPTLGDLIELVPFLPIEINVPDLLVGFTNFLSWMFNRNQNSTGRVYFVLDQGYPIPPFMPQPVFLP